MGFQTNVDSFQLVSLAFNLVIAVVVWIYYRQRSYASSKRYSTFFPRFWTGSVDACVLWPVTSIPFYLISHGAGRITTAVLMVIQTLTWLLYTIVMHARCGQTVGKMVTKVRVVDVRTESSISWQQAFLRESVPAAVTVALLGYQLFLLLTGQLSPAGVANGQSVSAGSNRLLIGLPLLWFAAEVLTMLTNKKRRALHDFIAGTVVIRTNALEEGAEHNVLFSRSLA